MRKQNENTKNETNWNDNNSTHFRHNQLAAHSKSRTLPRNKVLTHHCLREIVNINQRFHLAARRVGALFCFWEDNTLHQPRSHHQSNKHLILINKKLVVSRRQLFYPSMLQNAYFLFMQLYDAKKCALFIMTMKNISKTNDYKKQRNKSDFLKGATLYTNKSNI